MDVPAPKGVEKRTSLAKKKPTAHASQAGQAGSSVSSASASKNPAAYASQSSEAGPLATPTAPARSLDLRVSGAVPAQISHPTMGAAEREMTLAAKELKPDQSRSQQESLLARMTGAAKDYQRCLSDTSRALATTPTTSTGGVAHSGLASPLGRAASLRAAESSMQVTSRGEVFHLEPPRLVPSERADERRSLPGAGGSSSREGLSARAARCPKRTVADSISEKESTEIRRLYMSGYSPRYIAGQMSTFKPGENAKPRKFSHNTIKRHIITTNMNMERNSQGHIEEDMTERPGSRCASREMTLFPAGGYVPPSLTTSECKKIQDLHAQGQSQEEIAAEMGRCRTTISQYMTGQKRGTQNMNLKQDSRHQEEESEAGAGPQSISDIYEWLSSA